MGNALKDDYSPGLRNAINNTNVVWGEVTRNTEDIVGEQAVWSVHSGRSNASGGRGEGVALPTSNRQKHIKPRDDLKYLYHTIKVSGPAKHLTRNDTGSFVRAVETEVKGGEKDLKRDAARQSVGGVTLSNSVFVTGVLAVVESDPATGTAVVLSDRENDPAAAVGNLAARSITRHFFPGMAFCLINPADGVVRAGGPYFVSSIDLDTRTVNTTAAFNAAGDTGDLIVRCSNDSTASNSLDAEINGLSALASQVTTYDYAGVDVSANPIWMFKAMGDANTTISEVILDELSELVETDGDGGNPGLYLTEHSQRRKLASLLQIQKNYEGREMTLTSGWRGLNIARGTLVVDRFAPSDKVFALNMDEIELFVGLDFQWDEDDDGGVFFKALDGSDAIQARYKWYGNLEATNRNSHAVLTLAEPTFS